MICGSFKKLVGYIIDGKDGVGQRWMYCNMGGGL